MKRSLINLVLASSFALVTSSAFAIGGEHGNGDSGMGGMGSRGDGGMSGHSPSIPSKHDSNYGNGTEPSNDFEPEPAHPSSSGIDADVDGDPLMERATQEESGTASAGHVHGNRGTGAPFGEGFNGNFTHHGDEVKDPIETRGIGRD